MTPGFGPPAASVNVMPLKLALGAFDHTLAVINSPFRMFNGVQAIQTSRGRQGARIRAVIVGMPDELPGTVLDRRRLDRPFGDRGLRASPSVIRRRPPSRPVSPRR